MDGNIAFGRYRAKLIEHEDSTTQGVRSSIRL